MSDNWNSNDDGGDGQTISSKKNNVLPLWGNERSMNLNPLILTNIQSSHYFKNNLYELKTYHEVIDEIYYKVQHLEPWEKGSRKTSGQTGMCGGVRGVGAGGIVSTAYCLLYKLFTLKMTRKQLNGLINHTDSPYIRGLGFMYIRYTQPPADLIDWYEPYLEDEEEVDVKAGGGQTMTIGNILRSFLTKLEWFSTLFPRIPVPIQQKIEKKMSEKFPVTYSNAHNYRLKETPSSSSNSNIGGGGGNGRGTTGTGGSGSYDPKHIPDNEAHYGEAERHAKLNINSRYDDNNSNNRKSNKDYERFTNKDYNNSLSSYNNTNYKDRKYNNKDGSSSRNYSSPERKKHKYDNTRDKYDSSSRDKYESKKYSRDRSYSPERKKHYKDEYSSSRDKYSSSKDKYSSSKDKYSSSRDKYSSKKYDDEDDYVREKSSSHHRRH